MDIIIIGSGPAGVSAALYAKRAGADVTVISRGSGALAKAEKIENYYGLAEPVTGAELEANGIAGAKRLGVNFIEDEVVGVAMNDDFTGLVVQTPNRTCEAKAVALSAMRSSTVKRPWRFWVKGTTPCTKRKFCCPMPAR